MKLNRNKKKAIIIGYVGSAVGASDLFRFGKVDRFDGDVCGFKGLKSRMSIMKTRDNPAWRKIQITIDVLDDGV